MSMVFFLLHFFLVLFCTNQEEIRSTVAKQTKNRIFDLPYRGHFTMIYVEDNVNKTKRAREPINMKNDRYFAVVGVDVGDLKL